MKEKFNQKVEDGDLPGRTVFLRFVALIFLPIFVSILFATIVVLIGSIGLSADLFYMRGESVLLSLLPLSVAVLVALIVKWTISKKIALVILCITVVGAFVFIGTVAVSETRNTKPMVTAANSFKELPGLTREVKTNGDKFSPAPSGFIPCIDFMSESCPNITRTWDAAPDRELTVADLQKVLDDSGWKDVKIQNDECDMAGHGNGFYPKCIAGGMVGSYKATVRIDKIQHWELEMHLRLPTSAR